MARVIVGRRANGDNGIFVSPSGIDAFTALDSQLTLNISSKISQLILLGVATSTGLVALGAGRQPYVFLTNRQSMAGVPGYGNYDGPFRPSPTGFYGTNSNAAYADVFPDGSYMSLSVPSGTRVGYAVFNRAFS